jgi:cyclophilin family peptidyl-prolyl cis-trans isomerase
MSRKIFDRIPFDKILFVAVLGLMLGLPAPASWADAEKSADTEGTKMDYVLLKTSLGDITLELDRAAAPKTVANFLNYVEGGHYNGTIFHRVIAGFMIQGGGLSGDMTEKPAGGPIENEADNGLKNDKYAVAMARTSAPHSATAQFFINVKDNEFLNHTGKNDRGWGYAVFGKVVEGFDVVDKIEEVETSSRSYHDDVPVEPVIIESAAVIEYPAESIQ